MDEPAEPVPDTLGNLNLRAAAALVQGLVDGGARRAVLSPGSRSSPLALAADLCPHLDTTVQPDERCAAFYALGQARAERRPVVVIATSGTAPANWFAAVIEASMDQVPLVLISANRPEELLRTGANQTVDQERMFGSYPRDYHRLPAPHQRETLLYRSTGRRAADSALWPRPGPVHVDMAFREPLLPDASVGDLDWPSALTGTPQRPRVTPDPVAVDFIERKMTGRDGVIVCGRSAYAPEFAAAVTHLANRLGCPLIADPLSGLRWGPHDRERVLTAADLFLRRRAGGPKADWVLHFGAAPTSQAVQNWLAAQGDALIPIVESGDWPDPSRHSALAAHGDALSVAEALLQRDLAGADPDWLSTWNDLDRSARALLDDGSLRPAEAGIIRALESALPPDAFLFVGSSMPIRSLDAFARGRDDPLTVFGNRGASGIDGCVSTAAGLAHCRPTLGLIGDLALYHDMNGLLAVGGTDLKLVVIENGGGAIFGLLPQRRHPKFERLWRTPTGLSCTRIASLYDLRHTVVESGESMSHAFALPETGQGPELVEIRVDAEESWARHQDLWSAAHEL